MADVAYHTSDDTASASSTAIDDVTPFEATFYQHGPSWVSVGVVDELLALDAEMRSVRPVHGLAVDGTLCAMATVDSTNYRFLRRLSIGDSRELREMIEPERPQAPVQAPEPHRLRVIARLGDDGRVEHGVELVGGRRVLPARRKLVSCPLTPPMARGR